ncbi:HNH endonuclease [Phycicoccus endophyticus]|uniref:HNH endonuclease n=1 Tax=Phycicoccus endophyticus TaxID=1690220 RepID=A0A7G9R3J0_9MICO|nr:HNH endonuclease [Phycicoccus endophyticus]NHI19921.1 HNH endonuclease [Phycicoccus endophyticus]QNN50165.1 HNH endonuclease [Phycicoccus endophyticus]GGL27518.1 hypothetical protein GCM10012283_07120 [Phycicoccus endophyticus]
MKFPASVRELIIQRDAHRCARCSALLLSAPHSIHHRKPRGAGGTRDHRSIDPRNGVLVCGTGTTGCHGWIESHRAAAYATGWLLRSYDQLDKPLITLDGHAIYLTDDGGRSEVLAAWTTEAAREALR